MKQSINKTDISSTKKHIITLSIAASAALFSCVWKDVTPTEKKINDKNIVKEFIENTRRQAQHNDVLAQFYFNKSENTKALNHYIEALKKYETLAKNTNTEDKINMQGIMKEIGLIYQKQDDHQTAHEYYKQALTICEEIWYEKGIAKIIILLAETQDTKNPDQIYTMLLRWRDILKKIDTTKNEKNILTLKAKYATDIARYFMTKKINKKAEIYLQEALRIQQETADIQGIIYTLYQLGEIKKQENNYIEARQYFWKGLRLSLGQENKALQKQGYGYIEEIALHDNNRKKAYEYKDFKEEISKKLLDEARMKKQEEVRLKYESEKKETENKLQKVEIEKKSEKEKKMRYFVSFLFTVLTLGSRSSYQQFKAKRNLAKEKEITEDINKQLDEKIRELDIQKKQIEQKNIDVTDSINSAKRIQKVMLPTSQEIKELFPESFVLYQPKDIVSGDFYFVGTTKSGKKIVAVADCTGHGVPGAFISLVGHASLVEAIQNQNESAAKILDFISHSIRKKFTKDSDRKEKGINDGMDISLCVRDETNRTLEYAGAMNPIFIASKGQSIQEIKADKHPIGDPYSQKFTWYTNTTLQIPEETMLYLFSDGYSDQFWGPENRRFLNKRLKPLFETIHNLPVEQQNQELLENHKNRRKDQPQIDDITVMGIRL